MIDTKIENQKTKQVKVLLILDKSDVQLADKMLAKNGINRFDLVHVERPGEALEVLQNDKFDVIILDLLLRNTQGLDTFHQVQTAAGHIPIVVLSNFNNRELALQAINEGAHDYLLQGQGDDYLLERSLSYVIERKRILEELNEKTIYLDNILNFSKNTAIIAANLDYQIKYFNPVAEKMFEYKAGEMLGKTIMEMDLEEKIDPVHFKKAIEGGFKKGEFKYTIKQKKNNKVRYIEFKISGILGENHKLIGFLFLAQDVTHQKYKSKRLEFKTNFDSLTGLPNQMLFYDRMNQALIRAKRDKDMVALLYLNLKKIKHISDTMGPIVSEHLLKEAAKRLKDCVRKSDTLARIGKDKFIVILAKVNKSVDAATVSRKITASFNKPFYFESHVFYIQINIGISLYPADGNFTESLLKNAETALRCATEKDFNNYQFYTSGLTDAAHDRVTLENSLRKAVEQNEFVIHYEPQVDLNNGRINGMEALVRWQHPVLGMVYPAEFIQIAEETGLILQINKWVLYTACAQNKAWQRAGYAPFRIAVNLSKLQFKQQDLLYLVEKTLKDTGMEPRYLDLELTEKIVSSNERGIIYLLNKFKDMGVNISIDDFGTGYSSISNLRNLPISKLKIDQSFIRTISTDPKNKAISNAIISMARHFNFKVIAEGVETTEQLKYLQSIKCDEAQGYLFSKHLPSEAITQLLSKAKNNGGIKITSVLNMLGIE